MIKSRREWEFMKWFTNSFTLKDSDIFKILTIELVDLVHYNLDPGANFYLFILLEKIYNHYMLIMLLYVYWVVLCIYKNH